MELLYLYKKQSLLDGLNLKYDNILIVNMFSLPDVSGTMSKELDFKLINLSLALGSFSWIFKKINFESVKEEPDISQFKRNLLEMIDTLKFLNKHSRFLYSNFNSSDEKNFTEIMESLSNKINQLNEHLCCEIHIVNSDKNFSNVDDFFPEGERKRKYILIDNKLIYKNPETGCELQASLSDDQHASLSNICGVSIHDEKLTLKFPEIMEFEIVALFDNCEKSEINNELSSFYCEELGLSSSKKINYENINHFSGAQESKKNLLKNSRRCGDLGDFSLPETEYYNLELQREIHQETVRAKIREFSASLYEPLEHLKKVKRQLAVDFFHRRLFFAMLFTVGFAAIPVLLYNGFQYRCWEFFHVPEGCEKKSVISRCFAFG